MDAALLPSYLGVDISSYLTDNDQEGLSNVEYINITNAIGYLKTIDKQTKFAEFLKTLSRSEMISRTAKISKLVNILNNISQASKNDL